jgi:hypothetical protein
MKTSVKAITPKQASEYKKNTIPAKVIEVFNELINENMSHNQANVRQDEVVNRLVHRGLNRTEIFDRGWLDIESIYEKAGWKVKYDKPAYNENYPATFTFHVK